MKSELQTLMRKAESPEEVAWAVKRLDMAASKGIIHKNTASRRKSKLMRRCH